jgi:hypothetical protein
MKPLVLFGLAFALLTPKAMADIIEFRGGFCLTSVTTACTPDGWDVGDCLLLRYSPPNLGTNGLATEFSVLGQSFGDNYSLASGSLIGSTYQAVDGRHVGRIANSFTAQMRITKQSSLSETSKSVTLQGNIKDFGDTTGCDVGFQAAATNRP